VADRDVIKAALLLSGGVDSAALAKWKHPALAITVDYGQLSAEGEIRASAQIAHELSIPHEIVRVDCSSLGSGDLSGLSAIGCAPSSEWWPYRNQMLVTLSAMKAISFGVTTLLVGSVKSDTFHADGRPEFYQQLSSLLSMQEGGMRVEAPAAHLSSVQLVRTADVPLSLLAWTHSCHKAPFACGNCRGCWKREQVFNDLGYGSH
jgi:7-cyano-7-deazaguanine synthase